MKIIQGHGANADKVILSLCDYSGNWPKPFTDAGYAAVLVDLKHGDDVTRKAYLVAEIMAALPAGSRIVGVMAAPPCTDFTVSGAQYWPAKDLDGRTDASLAIVDACLWIVDFFKKQNGGIRFWVLENPVGRLPKLRPSMGKPKLYFNPCQYAGWLDDPSREAYTKKTGLWGEFEDFTHLKKEIEPVFITDSVRGRKYSVIHWYTGGGSEKTKEKRSMTPMGFATAFYQANKGDQNHA